MVEIRLTLADALKRAVASHQAGDLAAAQRLYKTILDAKPDHFDALHLSGVLECQQGRNENGVRLIDRALAIQPYNAEALYNCAVALLGLNRRQEALANLDKALGVRPDYVEALKDRGVALLGLNRPQEALASYDKALDVRPQDPVALCSRGIVLNQLNRSQEGLASIDRALAMRPDYPEALNYRGTILNGLHRHQEALESLDRALTVKPDYAEALNNRGVALHGLNRLQDALESHERALAIDLDPRNHSNLIFILNFQPEATAASHQAERARWSALHAHKFISAIPQHDNNPDPDRRLRIGYVSSHFRHQAATYAFGGVILCHDANQFDVVCYSDTVKEDDLTARFRNCVGKWHCTAGLSDGEVSNLIRTDGIDILVDCVGHMRGHRLLVFARKPAPVQVTAWGEPTGTGLKTMDYLLADRVLVPASERSLLAERVFDLPNFLGYWRPDELPEPNAPPAIANGYVTFGSFNRFIKIQDPVLRTWAAILRALPEARLLLKWNQRFLDSSQLNRVESVLQQEGVGKDRLKLVGRSERTSHFAAYQDVDIALDPFPHGGGMTTLDALWMGVPVVTWAGRTISSRLAASSLTALGLTDLIAPDAESYVKLAVSKAGDLDALARTRASLRERVARSELGDPARYTRAVETAYREMWRRWCASRRNAPADVSRLS